MFQSAGDLCFLHKTGARLRIVSELALYLLKRYLTAEFHILSDKHLTQAAACVGSQDSKPRGRSFSFRFLRHMPPLLLVGSKNGKRTLHIFVGDGSQFRYCRIDGTEASQAL